MTTPPSWPSNYSYPPCTLTDEETRTEMLSRELQTSQREKQEILAFEGHLAAASTKQTITESSSLLLSQLTSLDPQYELRGAQPSPVEPSCRLLLSLAGGGGAGGRPETAWPGRREPRGQQASRPHLCCPAAACERLLTSCALDLQGAPAEAAPSHPGPSEKPQPVPPSRAPAVSEPEPRLPTQHHPEAGECGWGGLQHPSPE